MKKILTKWFILVVLISIILVATLNGFLNIHQNINN